MENLNQPINKQEQLNKIINDTEEIIQNFRTISEIITEKLNRHESYMEALGHKTVNARLDRLDDEFGLGTDEIIIL